MDNGETGNDNPIKLVVDNASKPRNPRQSGSNPPKAGKPKEAKAPKANGNVTDLQEETALRQAFERQIKDAEGFGALVDRLAPEIQKAPLRNASKAMLLKLVAKKAGISLEALRKDLPPPEDGRLSSGKNRSQGDFLPYERVGNQFFLCDDHGKRPLCNFVAWIEEEILFD